MATDDSAIRQQSAGRSPWFWGGLIFAAALALRAIHLIQILPAPFFPFKMGDAASYDLWARQIAAGNWLGSEVFYQAPLYPYFLGVVYALLGDDTLVIRACQALLGSVSCVLLAGAGWRVLSKPVGIVAGLVLAAYAPAIFFDSLIQKSVLDSLFLCSALYLIGVILQKPSGWLWCALGMVIGCFVLTRENALVIVAAVLVWVAIGARTNIRRAVITAGWFLLGTAIVLFPVALRNVVVGGEFHLTTSQFGPNFYIGNNAAANGSYRPLRPERGSAKYERLDARELAEEALGRELSPAEVSSYWTGQAWQYVRRHPVAWSRLMLYKCYLTWNATELIDTEDQYTYAEWSGVLAGSGYVLHFGVLLPVAVFGVWVTWPQRAQLVPLYLIVLFYALSVVAFYVVGRYRYPLVPPLVLLASAGVVGARRFFRRASRRVSTAAVTTSLGVAIFCNMPAGSIDQMRATTHYNIGVEFDAIEQYQAALEQYLVASTLDPAHPGIHNNLGCDYLYLGQLDLAVRHLQQALAQNPDFPEALYNLGVTYMAQRDLPRAESCFARLVALKPNMVRAHFSLGVAAQRRGELGTARAAYRRALELEPDFTDARAALESLRDVEH